jgi:DNA repair protein RadC
MIIKYKAVTIECTLEVSDNIGSPLNNPKIVYELLKDDFNPTQEEIYLICLDNRNKIINKTMIGRGTLNATAIVPSDIFRALLRTNGNSFIIAHNHPSGNLDESLEDIQFTKKLMAAAKIMGFKFLDHLIFTAEGFTSLNFKGVMS